MQIIGLPCPREDTVENTDLQGRCQAGKKQRKGAGFARYGSLSSPLQSQMACKPILGGLQQTVGKLLLKPKECDHAKAASLHRREIKTTFKGKTVPFH